MILYFEKIGSDDHQGKKGIGDARRYIMNKMKEYGLQDVHTQPVQVAGT